MLDQASTSQPDSVSWFLCFYAIAMIVYETTTALWHLKGAHERLKRADTLWPVMCKISIVGKDNPKIDKIGQKNDIETILDESKYLTTIIWITLLTQASLVTMNVLRLYEWPISGCTDPACHKLASATVLAFFMAVSEGFKISAAGPLEAFEFSNKDSSIKRAFGAFSVITRGFASLAWLAYESWQQMDGYWEIEWAKLMVVIGFAAGLVVLIDVTGCEFNARWLGYHYFLRSMKEHSWFYRCLYTCTNAKLWLNVNENWFELIVTEQDKLRAEGQPVPSDLEASQILRECGWRAYIQAGDCKGLFEHVKRITDREGNLITGSNGTATAPLPHASNSLAADCVITNIPGAPSQSAPYITETSTLMPDHGVDSKKPVFNGVESATAKQAT
jgi:hypothetical protein